MSHSIQLIIKDLRKSGIVSFGKPSKQGYFASMKNEAFDAEELNLL